LDKNGKSLRNKARLVAEGYSRHEGICYKETYALVAHLEAIKILLSFATYNMKLYQMDVKSAFQNGIIQEEFYVEQSLRFTNDILFLIMFLNLTKPYMD